MPRRVGRPRKKTRKSTTQKRVIKRRRMRGGAKENDLNALKENNRNALKENNRNSIEENNINTIRKINTADANINIENRLLSAKPPLQQPGQIAMPLP